MSILEFISGWLVCFALMEGSSPQWAADRKGPAALRIQIPVPMAIWPAGYPGQMAPFWDWADLQLLGMALVFVCRCALRSTHCACAPIEVHAAMAERPRGVWCVCQRPSASSSAHSHGHRHRARCMSMPWILKAAGLRAGPGARAHPRTAWQGGPFLRALPIFGSGFTLVKSN